MYSSAIHPTATPANGRGPSFREHGPWKIGKASPLLESFSAAAEWVPAFAGKARGAFPDCMFDPNSFTPSEERP